MGHFVVKIKDRYLEWSTIVDAPISYGMTLEELTEYIRAEQGEAGLRILAARVQRADETGTSATDGTTLESLIDGNHAGPDESELTLDEIYQAWCLRKPIRNGWIP